MCKKRQLDTCSTRRGGSEKGSDHFGSYACSFSLHFYKSMFPVLEPWPHGHKGNTLPLPKGSPSVLRACTTQSLEPSLWDKMKKNPNNRLLVESPSLH
jgi:hypothetical protein